MASIAMMIAGAILNATAFTGSMVIAKQLEGKSVDGERERHDKAMEAYQRAMGEYEKRRQAYQDWLNKQYTDQKQADEI